MIKDILKEIQIDKLDTCATEIKNTIHNLVK